jgi:hypothetical protein
MVIQLTLRGEDRRGDGRPLELVGPNSARDS